jgi:hypothetical protein
LRGRGREPSDAGGSRRIANDAAMRELSLRTAGAWCAILLVAGFIIGIVLMATNGVQVLIPETGKDGLDWIADVDDAGNWFVAGAAIVVFAGLFGVVAFLGFYDALRDAGPLLILAPVVGVAGFVLVTISHATPIAIAVELVPDYTTADEATRASLTTTFDTLAQFCLLMNYFGDILIWGVTTPLFAIAVLQTRAVPRWIGWVGLFSAAVAGWLGLLSPVVSMIEEISTLGFFAFFIFMASMGVALLRSPAADQLPDSP